jgi:hypothetical protein
MVMDLPITPPVCSLLADQLAESIDILRGWGFRLDESSRLPAAVRELRRVAEEGYPTVDRLVLVGNAVRIGLDYPRLCQALSNGTPEPVREVVRRSLGGSLASKRGSPARKAQAELRLVSVIAASGRNALVPKTGTVKSPDVVVMIDGLPCAIEVKCPQSVASLTSSVEKAVRQLVQFGSQYCGVCLDLSDCLEADGTLYPQGASREKLHTAFRTLDGVVSRYIPANYSRRGFDRILLLITAATPVVWEQGPPLVLRPLLLQGLTPFPQACSGLLNEQIRSLMRTIQNGYVSLGASLNPTPM